MNCPNAKANQEMAARIAATTAGHVNSGSKKPVVSIQMPPGEEPST
jgi:hypothetical protein